MCYVGNEQEIFFKIDGFVPNSVDIARNYCKENGLTIVKEEVTFMGNYLIWVEA